MFIYDITNKNGLKDIKKNVKLDDNSFKTEFIILWGNKSDFRKKLI